MDLGLIAVPLISLLASLGLVVAFDTNSVTISNIDVPGMLSADGYTSQVVTARLVDSIREIDAEARTAKAARGVELASEITEFEALGEYFDIKETALLIRDTFGFDNFQLSGEIVVISDEELEFRLRGKDRHDQWHMAFRRGERATLDDLIFAAAEEAVKMMDPYVLAAYYFSQEEDDGNFSDTLATINYALAALPEEEHSWLYNLWGLVYLVQFDPETAEQYFTRAISLDPEFVHARFNEAIALSHQGRFAAAISLFEEAADLSPYMPGIYVEWANATAALGRIDDAFALFDRAIAVDPNFEPIYSQRGDLYLRLGDMDAALADFRLAATLEPTDTAYDTALRSAVTTQDIVDLVAVEDLSDLSR